MDSINRFPYIERPGDEERFQLAHLAFFGFLSIFFVSFCVPHLEAMVTRLVHLATHTLSSYTFFSFGWLQGVRPISSP
jgi:hypothetical protein